MHSFDSSSGPSHPMPPNCACTFLGRERSLFPTPQPALQSPQSPHWSHSQLMGHGRSSHSFTSRSRPSASLPPCSAMTSLFRIRDVVPGPHQLEHPDQPVHSPQTPSTGQGCVLQAVSRSFIVGHLKPPYSGFVRTKRFCATSPAPQETLQGPLSCQGVISQSTGQGCPLHSTNCSRG